MSCGIKYTGLTKKFIPVFLFFFFIQVFPLHIMEKFPKQTFGQPIISYYESDKKCFRNMEVACASLLGIKILSFISTSRVVILN